MIVGITRRTLQEYDRIGLICPTAKTEGGYWLYDDDTIRLLMTIQVFVEVGYKRTEIKKMINSSGSDIATICDRAINLLAEKQERIRGTMNMLQALKLTDQAPPFMMDFLSNPDRLILYQSQSYTQFLEKSIKAFASIDGIDTPETQKAVFAALSLIILGMLEGQEVESECVLECVQYFTGYFSILVRKHDPESKLSESQVVDVAVECITDLLREPTSQAFFIEYCGEGSIDFMINAFTSYIHNQHHTTEEA